jgi:hypothetical protein
VKKVLLAAALGTLAACSDATSPSISSTSRTPRLDLASGNNTVTVREADIARQAEDTPPTDNWVFYVRNGGTGSFVNGPGTAPIGFGSFQISTPASSDKGFLFNFDHTGVALSSITAISYSTYVSSLGSVPTQAPSLNIQIDKNGGTLEAGDFTTLVFEPVYNTSQATVTINTWQSWDAFNGTWWSSNPINGLPNRDTFVSWSDLVAANPNATIIGGFGVNQGSGNAGLVGAVDALTIAYGGNSVTYDFEDSACHFSESGNTKTLQGDCTTTSTISVPNGFTLDGNGYTITAKDPAGGHFVGAVIANAGASANVINVTVTASGLSNVCDGGNDRLRGILFDGASGSITGNTVTGVRQGLSGCQEGNAIEARNAPFAGETGSVNVFPDVNVTISNNTVTNYQKNGITVNGAVIASVLGNVVTGDGPISYIAQNGIQIGFGGTATVRNNTVSGNAYAPATTEACGLLLYRADGVKAAANDLFNNQKNQCNYGKGGGNVGATN